MHANTETQSLTIFKLKKQTKIARANSRNCFYLEQWKRETLSSILGAMETGARLNPLSLGSSPLALPERSSYSAQS